MKKLTIVLSVLVLSVLVLSTSIFAQSETKPDFSKEIDEQVWEPFKEAYANYDAGQYIALHTEDVLRITKWGGIKKGEAFREGIQKNFNREDKLKHQLEFQFEHRIHSTDVAYEVGYYKMLRITKEGKSEEYYGRFHVVLKKIAGIWKITQDWDTGNINGHEVTAKDFQRLENPVEPITKTQEQLDGLYLTKVASLDSILENLYGVISGEAGEERDWDLFRYLFKSDAKLIPSSKNRKGKVSCSYMAPADYVQLTGKWLVENGFFEKEIFRKVETFGSMTQVFSTYEAFKSEKDEAPFMRGINSIQLLNDGKRWWIVNIYWRQETPENVLTEEYLKR